MKNTIISLFLFILVMSFVFYGRFELISICNKLDSRCELIEDNIKKNNLDLAYENSIDLLNILENDTFISTLYSNHCDFENLTNQTIALSLYIENGDLSEALANVHIIKYSAKAMKNLQNLTFKNIF